MFSYVLEMIKLRHGGFFLKINTMIQLDKVKYRNKLTGNIACKSKGKWIDSVTKQELLSYQVYKQVSLFAKILASKGEMALPIDIATLISNFDSNFFWISI